MRILHVFFILFFLCISLFSFADSKPGGIRGVVKLSNGKPAAYVSVTLTGTTKGAITEESGSFIIRNVNAGRYELEVSLAGYEKTTQTVTVSDGSITEVAFSLNISAEQLEEVVVRTGRSSYKSNTPSSTLRLNEPLNEAPQNIQVITNKLIADQQITSLSDGITRNVSGLTRLEHWGDMYTRINMRGGRASAFRNGINVNSNWGPLTEDMSFVDHIEFVKGPAGFMMSYGEPSGIYNVVTKRPTGQTKGEASLLFGSYDFYRSTLDLDGKLSKDGKLLYRFNMMGQTKNSFRPYEYNNRYSIAPVISYKIDDNTTITAEYILQHAKMSDVGSYYVFSTKGYGTLPRNFTMTNPGLDPTIIDDQSITVNFQHSFSADWKLTAQAAYYDYKQQGSDIWPSYVGEDGNIIRNLYLWDAASNSKFGQVFVNGNVKTGFVQHRILGGLDIGDKEYMADFNQSHLLDTLGSFNVNHPAYGTPVNGYPKFNRDNSLRQRAGAGIYTNKYTSLYLQDELGFLNNTIRLTLAGRYTKANQTDYGSQSEASRFTPRVGVSVSVDKQTSIYALFDQSFVPQTGIRRDNKAVTPITSNNIEAGIKKDWFGGKWNTSASVYRILQNNQTSSDPTDSTFQGYVIQFGQTRSQGIEFDLRGQILPGLNLIANYALTDSKITEADENNKSTIGQKVPGYAKHVANAWLTYKLQRGALEGFGVNAGFTYQVNRTTWSWGAAGEQNLPNYFKLDGGLTYDTDKFTITANVFNLLNKYLYSGAYYQYIGAYYWQAEAGRNLRLGVSFRF